MMDLEALVAGLLGSKRGGKKKVALSTDGQSFETGDVIRDERGKIGVVKTVRGEGNGTKGQDYAYSQLVVDFGRKKDAVLSVNMVKKIDEKTLLLMEGHYKRWVMKCKLGKKPKRDPSLEVLRLGAIRKWRENIIREKEDKKEAVRERREGTKEERKVEKKNILRGLDALETFSM